ncbi:MAG TPA: C25 family cysteine peptidase, partial [Pyrinomonadaceae bacterium]|nr:C25 family cysteine peptidase [Pyrinomonadaceae bacterium]
SPAGPIIQTKPAVLAAASSQTTVNAGPLLRKRTNAKKSKRRKQAARHFNHAEMTSALAPSSFDTTVLLKERLIYYPAPLNGDVENFFGRVIVNTAVNENLDTPNPQFAAAGPAKLEVAMQGVSSANHQIDVSLNNTPLGSITFIGQSNAKQTFDVPIALLINGANTLTLTPATSGVVSIVDYARITYPHAFRADADILKFNLRGTQSLSVDGFSNPTVRLIDYTDPFAVSVTKLQGQAAGGGYSVTIPTGTPAKKDQRLLYASLPGQFQQVAALSLNEPSTINSGQLNQTVTTGADFLIIAHKSLKSAADALVTARTSQGFKAAVVNVEDIYDEFSYGQHGPQPVRDFLAYAASHWAVQPRYVIFLGDASYDYRNYLNLGDFDLVPTKLVDATFNETASDDWLADFDDDGVANIPVGRIPVRTLAEANLVVSKIVNFTPVTPEAAMLIADDPGTPPAWDFETASDDVQALLPAAMTVQRVNVRTGGSTTDIINGFNQGRAVINYSGHGNVDVWSGASIFTSNNALALTNGAKLPLVIVMDCLNGYFHEANGALLSMSEAFLKAPNGGAVAAFASSGLTSTPGQREMELELYRQLYGSQPIALGDAIHLAKNASSDIDVKRTWIYFGDPSLKIR